MPISRTLITCGIAALAAVVSACSPPPAEKDATELAALEVGNTGGLNYGEFGPADAYENGSTHPFYGSENQWSRRMFEKRAADLYYKRRGQRQMLEIIDGKPEAALALADLRLKEDPADAESHYIRAIAYAQLDDLDAAWNAMTAALDAGLAFERFLAGPRDLLAPLTASSQFQAMAERQGIRIVQEDGKYRMTIAPEVESIRSSWLTRLPCQKCKVFWPK